MLIKNKRKPNTDVNIEFSIWKDAFDRLKHNTMFIISLCIILILVIVAIFGPLLTPYDFLVQDLTARNEGPSAEHFFGTDTLGRDIYSRIIYGARTAVFISIITVVLSTVIGVIIGSASVFIGGMFDKVVMWLIGIIIAVPGILIAAVASISLRPGMTDWMEAMYMRTKIQFFRESSLIDFFLIIAIIVLVSWPGYARLIRGQLLSIKQQNYVTAARALAVRPIKIVAKYMIPNALGPIIVSMFAGFGSSILTETAFSFIGIGVRPPIPSWGNMLKEGLNNWTSSPHLLLVPGIVISIITIAFNFFGDGLNDALDNKKRGR